MPQRLAGLKFANLQVDEFACPPELLSAPRYVEANVGEYFEFCYVMSGTEKNPSIYNIIRWVAWTMGQTNHRPSV